MSKENRILQALTLVATLLTAVVPAYVAYDLFALGTSPPKQLELRQVSILDPLREFTPLGDQLSLQLKVRGQAIENVAVVKAGLRNTGASPILPSDFHENLIISVKAPWQIVAVEPLHTGYRDVDFRWARVSETSFEAKPILMNAGDVEWTNIYLTNTGPTGTGGDLKPREPHVEWKARITNLRAIRLLDNDMDVLRGGYRPFLDSRQGWPLVVALVSALSFVALYVFLLRDIGIVSRPEPRVIAAIFLALLLSFAAADSIATYLFQDAYSVLMGIEHWRTALSILANALVLLLLYLWRRHKQQEGALSR